MPPRVQTTCWPWRLGAWVWPAAAPCPLPSLLHWLPSLSSHAVPREERLLEHGHLRLLDVENAVASDPDHLPLRASWPRAPAQPWPRCWPLGRGLLGRCCPPQPACLPAADEHGRRAAAWSRWLPQGPNRSRGWRAARGGPRHQCHGAAPRGRERRLGAALGICNTPMPWQSTARLRKLDIPSRLGGRVHHGLLLPRPNLLRRLGWCHWGDPLSRRQMSVRQTVGCGHWVRGELLPHRLHRYLPHLRPAHLPGDS